MGDVIVVILACWAIFFMMESTPEYEAGEKALILIEECESKLKRNQKCTIISVEANNETIN